MELGARSDHAQPLHSEAAFVRSVSIFISRTSPSCFPDVTKSFFPMRVQTSASFRVSYGLRIFLFLEQKLLRFSASRTLSVYAQLFSHIRVLLLEPGTFTRSFESAMPPKKRSLSATSAKAKRRKMTLQQETDDERTRRLESAVGTFETFGRSPSSFFL